MICWAFYTNLDVEYNRFGENNFAIKINCICTCFGVQCSRWTKIEGVIDLADDGILQLILNELRDLKQGQANVEQNVAKLVKDVDLIKLEIILIKDELEDVSVAVTDISRKLDVVSDRTVSHERTFANIRAAI